MNRSDSFFTLLEEGQQYTFEEMYQLWHQKEVYVRLYTMLTPLSIDQRLLTLRQLIKRDLVSQYTGDAELEQLGKCLLERPFSEWYRGSFGHICGLTRRVAMGLLQHYTQLQAFIPDFTTESDAVFALNNMMALLEMTDWKQVRKDILTTDADWLDLKRKTGIFRRFCGAEPGDCHGVFTAGRRGYGMRSLWGTGRAGAGC